MVWYTCLCTEFRAWWGLPRLESLTLHKLLILSPSCQPFGLCGSGLLSKLAQSRYCHWVAFLYLLAPISVQVSFKVFCLFNFDCGEFQVCTKRDSSIRNPHVLLTSVQKCLIVLSLTYTLLYVPQQSLSPGMYTSVYLLPAELGLVCMFYQ